MTEIQIATARAFSNIAFIKYWGNRDDGMRLPANGSLSMNVDGIATVTTVRFSETFAQDRLILNGREAAIEARERVTHHLDHLRQLAGTDVAAIVVSENNFPMGSGIASSAAAFAALTLAACSALHLKLDERTLTTLARLGSGSASRSIPAGFVEWHAGEDHESSFAETIAPPNHWDLVDLVAVVSREHKVVGSSGGHRLAETSPLQSARVADAPRRLAQCRSALLSRDFAALAETIEEDALLMHAVMMTSHPPLLYWQPPTLRVLDAVRDWRCAGVPVCFTIDAGPNVHVLTTRRHQASLLEKLRTLDGVEEVLSATTGGPAVLLESHLNVPTSISRD